MLHCPTLWAAVRPSLTRSHEALLTCSSKSTPCPCDERNFTLRLAINPPPSTASLSALAITQRAQ